MGLISLIKRLLQAFCSRMTIEGYGIGSCYSSTCPNRQTMATLERAPSTISIPASVTSSEVSAPQEDTTWKSTVPEEVLLSIGEREVKRQEVIWNLIASEGGFLEDFDFIETVRFFFFTNMTFRSLYETTMFIGTIRCPSKDCTTHHRTRSNSDLLLWGASQRLRNQGTLQSFHGSTSSSTEGAESRH
jgi:hypothetical protein